MARRWRRRVSIQLVSPASGDPTKHPVQGVPLQVSIQLVSPASGDGHPGHEVKIRP